MGHVSLTVASLDNQIAFYTEVLGFELHWREGNRAGLGAPSGDLTTGRADLLRLTEEPNLKRYRGVTGLYHFAVLFPGEGHLPMCHSHGPHQLHKVVVKVKVDYWKTRQR